jgi:uncharacterized membrane protein
MFVLEALFGVCVVAGLVAMLALPIIALVRTRRIAELTERVAWLEREILRQRHAAGETAASEPPASAKPIESVQAAPAKEEEVLDVLPATTTAPAEEPAPAAAPPRRRRPAALDADAATLESWVGQKALGWAAVVLLLFATAFFLKWTFDNRLIGELGRVSLGIIGGAGFCIAGLVAHQRKHRLTSQMLSAAGVVLLYLSTFSAFGYYRLLPRDHAAIFLIIVVVQTAALAVLYDAPAIAVMAIAGGLLSPILLRSDHDRYVSLFFYLAVLNAGVVGLALFRRWLFLAPIALVGTQTLYWSWHLSRYHPEKFAAAALFQLVIFVLYLGHDLISPVLRKRSAHPIQLVQLLVNAFFFGLASYVLLEEDSLWMPAVAIGLAVVYSALAGLVEWRLPEDTWLQLAAVATGLSFIAASIALRGEAGWISLGWAVEGAALWWFGLRIRGEPLRWLGAALLALAVGRLVFVNTPWSGRGPFVPIFNTYALPALVVCACVLLAAWAARRLPSLPDVDRAAWWLLGLGGVMLVWMVLSFETYQYALQSWVGDLLESQDRTRFAQMSLSIFWAIYAGVVLAVGFWRSSRPLRVTALGLFGLTMAKVVLIDMAGLPGFYRVAAFFALAVIMGTAAWAYQRSSGSSRRLAS